MNPLANELNKTLDETVAGKLLSPMGRRIFFPKGIIAQSAEAKKLGHKANATIGTARKDGKPLILEAVQEQLPNLTPAEAVAYAPTAGNLDLRKAWLAEMVEKNPSLKTENISLPVVVPGLTAGISYIADLFISDGDALLAGDPAWDNYNLIIEARHDAELKGFQMLNLNGFDIEAFKRAVIKQAETGKVQILLNFPQNPAGYTLKKNEYSQVVEFLTAIAEQGTNLLVCCDDAYFGLFYEDDIAPESLFAALSQAHKNILAVKIDGPTKEDYVWGLRTGFLTFGCKDMTPPQYEALIKKLMGVVRSSVSCCATPSQSIMLKTLNDSRTKTQKAQFVEVLKERYQIVKDFLKQKQDSKVLTPMPFNSGYFMSLTCNGFSAEALRVKLLNDHGIGTIAIDDSHLRIAFSSLETDSIIPVYTAIYDVAEKL